jgi:hypothetical protein
MMEEHAPEDNQPENGEAPTAEPPSARKRGRLNLRGHVIIDADEPLLLADSPADPPPIAPSTIPAEAFPGNK